MWYILFSFNDNNPEFSDFIFLYVCLDVFLFMFFSMPDQAVQKTCWIQAMVEAYLFRLEIIFPYHPSTSISCVKIISIVRLGKTFPIGDSFDLLKSFVYVKKPLPIYGLQEIKNASLCSP